MNFILLILLLALNFPTKLKPGQPKLTKYTSEKRLLKFFWYLLDNFQKVLIDMENTCFLSWKTCDCVRKHQHLKKSPWSKIQKASAHSFWKIINKMQHNIFVSVWKAMKMLKFLWSYESVFRQCKCTRMLG